MNTSINIYYLTKSYKKIGVCYRLMNGTHRIFGFSHGGDSRAMAQAVRRRHIPAESRSYSQVHVKFVVDEVAL